MRNLDGGRWEKGVSASEMEAFIFLFCWSANVLKVKAKKKKPNTMKAELKEEESFHTGPHGEEYFSPDLFLVAMLSLSLLRLSVKIWKSYLMHPWIHISAPSGCSERENSIHFLTVIYTCAFFSSLRHLRWKHMCDHGQHFPFLKCLLLLSLCQFVSEENSSWKTPLFGFALSMETGP